MLMFAKIAQSSFLFLEVRAGGFFETWTHAIQAGLQLAIQSAVAVNSESVLHLSGFWDYRHVPIDWVFFLFFLKDGFIYV